MSLPTAKVNSLIASSKDEASTYGIRLDHAAPSLADQIIDLVFPSLK